MKKLLLKLSIISLFFVAPYYTFAANRITTWSANQVLTAAALNGEFNNLFSGTLNRTGGSLGHDDDVPEYFGTSGATDAHIEWDTGQTNDTLVLGLNVSQGGVLLIIDQADFATDLALAARTDPAIIIHSADSATAADYLELRHNQTDSVINTGNGGIDMQVAGTRRAFLEATGLTIVNTLTANGAVGLGDAAGDAITVTGTATFNTVARLASGIYLQTIDGGATARAAIGMTGNDLYVGSADGSGAVYFRFRGTTFTQFDGTTFTINAVPTDATATWFVGGTPLVLEGATPNDFETQIVVTDPTADRLATLPNSSGTFMWINTAQTVSAAHTFTGDGIDFTGAVLAGGTPLVLEGATPNDFETQILVTDPTADRQITLPNVDGTVALGTGTVNQLTYWTATNTITGIGDTGSTGQVLRSAGAGAPTWSTATYPATATTTGAYLRADGTNWIMSTLVLPNAATVDRIPYATAANTWGDSANLTFNGSTTTFGGLTTAGGSVDLNGGVSNQRRLRWLTTGSLRWHMAAEATAEAGANAGSNFIIAGFSDTGVYLGAWFQIVRSSGVITMPSYGAGTATFDANGVISSVSDERLKEVQGAFVLGLNEILQLSPITFKWNKKSGLDQKNVYAGFSAQNVMKYIPEAIGLDSNGYYTMNDRPLLLALVNAIKTLTLEIDDLRRQVGLPAKDRTSTPIIGDARVIKTSK